MLPNWRSPKRSAAWEVSSNVKGLEADTNLRMTQVIDEVLPGHPAGVLAGPNLARQPPLPLVGQLFVALHDAVRLFEHRHDVVIVGARAAGASTAMLLARAGFDVLVVDRAGVIGRRLGGGISV